MFNDSSVLFGELWEDFQVGTAPTSVDRLTGGQMREQCHHGDQITSQKPGARSGQVAGLPEKGGWVSRDRIEVPMSPTP